MSRQGVVVLGHRGGRGDGWPAENSLAAFQRALDEGADGVELDVRLCASGEPVLLHDPTLSRLTDGRDARSAHVVPRSALPLLEGGARVPDLAEALDLCHGRIVNVEVKPDVPRRLPLVRAVVRAIEEARSLEVVLSSFDPAIVLACAALAPRVRRAILVGTRTPRLATALPLAMRAVAGAAHVDEGLLTGARISRLRRGRLRVVAWTVNDAARAMTLVEEGAETIITDQPRAIVAALRRGHGGEGASSHTTR